MPARGVEKTQKDVQSDAWHRQSYQEEEEDKWKREVEEMIMSVSDEKGKNSNINNGTISNNRMLSHIIGHLASNEYMHPP